MKEKTIVSFPGLGIGEFTIDPVAVSFTIGEKPIEIRWYGIVICIGMILAFLYVWSKAKNSGFTFDDVLDIALTVIPCGVIGARIYYVLMSPDEFHNFYDVIAIWNGGIAIYGALIGGGISLLCLAKIKKKKVGLLFDMLGPAAMIGQICGRWGNFFNGEAHGVETEIFCRMGLYEGGKMIYVHPTFLYESLWNLLGFILINAFYKKKKFDWQIFLEYIAWYGFGRMFIEGLRTDSLYLGPWRISQVVGFFCFVIGTSLLIYKSIKIKKYSDADLVEYAGVYSKLTRKTEKHNKVSEEEEKKIVDSIINKHKDPAVDTTPSDSEPDEDDIFDKAAENTAKYNAEKINTNNKEDIDE